MGDNGRASVSAVLGPTWIGDWRAA